jgi:hypothetical protein
MIASLINLTPRLLEKADTMKGRILIIMLLILNTGFFWFPKSPEGSIKFIKEIKKIPVDASVQAMAEFYPYTNYSYIRTPLMQGQNITADYIILRDDLGSWGWDKEKQFSLISDMLGSKTYENISGVKNLYIFRKRPI